MIYDGFPWDIKGIAEVGFRRELDLICQTDVHREQVPFTPTDLGNRAFSLAFGLGFA